MSGGFYICLNYHFFTIMTKKLGRVATLRFGTCAMGIPIFLIPFTLLVQKATGETGGELTWAAYFFLGIATGLQRIFASCHFGTVTLLCNESVISSHRGTMNGLSALGGSIAKAIAPAFAGLGFAFLASGESGLDPAVGTFVCFFAMGVLALFMGFFTFFVKKVEGTK